VLIDFLASLCVISIPTPKLNIATAANAAAAAATAVQVLIDFLASLCVISIPTPKVNIATAANAAAAAATAAQVLIDFLASLCVISMPAPKVYIATAANAAAAAATAVQVLIDFSASLCVISTPAPQPVLETITSLLAQRAEDLSPPQLATAMSSLNKLAVAVDQSVIKSYWVKAQQAAVAGSATAQDMAVVLMSLVTAGTSATPSAEWLQQYLAVAADKLAVADAGALAGILWATAKLGGQPSQRWLQQAVAAAKGKLGSHYMESGRYLGGTSYTMPFSLAQLADAVWGLVKLGVASGQIMPLTNMLISKSHERLSQLNPSQLVGVLWAVSECGVSLTQKWMNQLGIILAPEGEALTLTEFQDVLTALTWQCGCSRQAAIDSISTSSSSSSGSSAPCYCCEPLLQAVASQTTARLQQLTTADVSMAVAVLAHHGSEDVAIAPAVLQRYCLDRSTDWSKLPDVALVESGVAVAVLSKLSSSSSSSSSGDDGSDWLQQWVQQYAQAVVER
jgi:hypothetical protein